MLEFVNVDLNTPVDEKPGEKERRDPGTPSVSYRRVLWSTLLSFSVVLLIAYFTFDIEDFRDTLRQLNPWYLAAAVGSVVLRVLLGGWRLRYVSQARLDLNAGVRGQLAWDFFSNVTPSAIGGGPVAAVYVARDRNLPVGEVTAIILFTMLLDQFLFALLIPLLLLLMPFAPVFPPSLGPVGTGAFVVVFIGLMVWVFGFGYTVLYRPDLLQRVIIAIVRIKWLRRFRERVTKETDELRERTKLLRNQPPSFFVAGVMLTAAVWTARFCLPLLIVMSVYPDVDTALTIVRTIAMSITTIVLPTPGGSGGVEGLYALFIGPLLTSHLVAPTLLTWRFLAYYVFLLAGVYLSMQHVHTSIRRKLKSANGAMNGTDESEQVEAEASAAHPRTQSGAARK
jgi:uncharacterized protein (TIRG00374 family)